MVSSIVSSYMASAINKRICKEILKPVDSIVEIFNGYPVKFQYCTLSNQ